MKLNKNLLSFFLGISVFALAIVFSFFAYSFTKRNEPILYRSPSTENFNYVDSFIQNQFRDKTKENVANAFFESIKGKTISESFAERKHILNSYQDCGEGKVAKWELWNRYDGEIETDFYYAVTRELSPNLFHLSFVILKLSKENSEWKVKGYVCRGTSNKTWKS